MPGRHDKVRAIEKTPECPAGHCHCAGPDCHPDNGSSSTLLNGMTVVPLASARAADCSARNTILEVRNDNGALIHESKSVFSGAKPAGKTGMTGWVARV